VSSVPPDFDLGTLDSDEEMTQPIQLTQQAIEDVDLGHHKQQTTRSPTKLIPEKTADRDRVIIDYLRGISRRQMSIEEKLDNLQKTVDMIYRSAPSVPITGARGGVVKMTQW
jgi:hypothetical protein